MKKFLSVCFALSLAALSLFGCGKTEIVSTGYTFDTVPAYSDMPYVELNGNIPQFTNEQLKAESFERYSPLDSLGRCGEAFACLSLDTMPTEERGAIGQIKPSGWQTVKYDIVDGKYLYNRCHLIGFQLSGENANKENLITGTRYMNTEGMLPFENLVAEYIEETHNHVLYRATPVYDGDNLVARGVVMEAQSVEDDGRGICFNVYVYNAQPGITINYKDGRSCLAGEEDTLSAPQGKEYIINENSKKIHLRDCSAVDGIKAENKREYTGNLQALLDMGYQCCKMCNPLS